VAVVEDVEEILIELRWMMLQMRQSLLRCVLFFYAPGSS
jgi:hypothetical protein